MKPFARYFAVLLFVTHSVACLDSEPVEDTSDETELTAAEVAELDDAVDEQDHATDDTVVEDDAATFDTADVDPSDEAAIFDDDLATEAATDDAVESADDTVALAAARPLLKWGLHQRASDALRGIGVHASRIMQTIGNARASVGYHKRDGYFHGKPYTAAVDISVRGLSAHQIRNLLERLGKVGFAGWYRQDGHDGWRGVNHIHAVYARCKMKSVLRAQVHAWLAGRTGLSGNGKYHFHTFSKQAKAVVRAKFKQSHSGTSNR